MPTTKKNTSFLLVPLLVIFMITSHSLLSQNAIINGWIKDKTTGEYLIGATIFEKSSKKGAQTTPLGRYEIKIPTGERQLEISFIGYQTLKKTINIKQNTELNFSLSPSNIDMKEITVTGANQQQQIQSTESGLVKFSAKEIEKLPTILGEPDLMTALSFSPGVQSASDGNSGLYVRGGNIDQNLILLDNALITNPSHILGFFSVFNPDVIENVNLIKSGFPAQYGGRLASIIDISGKDGNEKGLSGAGSFGLISSKLMLHGPVNKNNLSFLVAYRRSYIDEVIKPMIKPLIKKSNKFYNSTNYYFQDLNAKITWKPTPKDYLAIMLYTGGDNFIMDRQDINLKNKLNWRNLCSSLNWKHYWKENLLMSTSLGYSDYTSFFKAEIAGFNGSLKSGMIQLNAKSFLNFYFPHGSTLKAGIEVNDYKFIPNKLNLDVDATSLKNANYQELFANEISPFASYETDLSPKIRLNLGLRYNYYLQTGPFTHLQNSVSGEPDTTIYKKNQIVYKDGALNPRVNLRYLINNHISIKASYSASQQHLHLASASAVTVPFDFWIPASKEIEAQSGQQVTLGYYHNLPNGFIVTSELFYKTMHNQLELLYGLSSYMSSKPIAESVTFGSGESGGIEFMLKKSSGSFNGWLGYTLSYTNRQFDEINDGLIFPAKFDRRHDINWVGMYKISEKFEASAAYVFTSGNALTIPVQKYMMAGNLVNIYSKTNDFRMPNYHRLDVSLNYYPKKKDHHWQSHWSFSIYNLYNRANPFYIYFEVKGDVANYDLTISAKQVSISPILPTITWHYKF